MEGFEERELLNMFRKDIGHIPLLTKEQEYVLAGQIRQGDPKAMNRLIEANLRLVLKLAFHYWKPGYPVMDMISEACLGLIRSAKTFNPDAGVRFVTYAFPAIKQGVIRAIVESHRNTHESLDAPSFEDNGESLLDNLASEGNTPEEEAETHDIGQYLKILTDREQYIIEQRFWKDRDLRGVGASLGVGKDTIRQIEIRALIKLRRTLEEMDISWQKPA